MKEQIKEYWEGRAKSYGGAPAATTEDTFLRELEIATLIRTLRELDVPQTARVLDVGCGDGYSTIRIAEALPKMSFLGIDYSEGMMSLAGRRLAACPELTNRVSFMVGDVEELEAVCAGVTYGAVISDRCLINLDSLENQFRAIAQIAKCTAGGGFYIAIENFIEGHENMNAARREVGLPPIPVRWHNLYFREYEFVRATSPFFRDITFSDFSSSYYFATRVIYSAMCQMRGETPDYNHEIHRLSVRLPPFGEFSPIRMAVLRRK
jgi:SAM-dependent methyltransferase